MFTGRFWRDATERAVRAAAASFGAVLGADSAGLLGVDWPGALSVAGGAGLLSLVLSIAAGKVTDPETAGFVSLRRRTDRIHRM